MTVLEAENAMSRAAHAMAVIAATEKALSIAQEAKRASVVELVQSGLTYREVGALLELSHQRVGQLVKAHAEAWGPVPVYTAADHLQAARAAFQAARIAQESRCEAYAMGYAGRRPERSTVTRA